MSASRSDVVEIVYTLVLIIHLYLAFCAYIILGVRLPPLSSDLPEEENV